MFDTNIRDVAEATIREVANRLKLENAAFLPAEELFQMIQQHDAGVYNAMLSYFKALQDFKLFEATLVPGAELHKQSQRYKESVDLRQRLKETRQALLASLPKIA